MHKKVISIFVILFCTNYVFGMDEESKDPFIKEHDVSWYLLPLHAAVKKGSLDCVKKVAQDGNIEEPDGNGITPLSWAAFDGHASIVLYLLTRDGKKALANTRNQTQGTPLHMAAMRGHASIIWILAGYKPDLIQEPMFGNTPFHCAAQHNSKESIQALIAIARATRERETLPLLLAVRNKQEKCAYEITDDQELKQLLDPNKYTQIQEDGM